MKNQSARGAEDMSAEATGAIGESASCHIKDCGVQNARQNYVEIVSLVMGAMCCQPAKMYGTLSSRLFRHTLSHWGSSQTLCHSFRASARTDYCFRSTMQALGGERIESQ